MGRVYNALVRAERWQDRDRPIGSPVRADAEASRADDPSTVLSFNVDSPTITPFSVEHGLVLPEESADLTARTSNLSTTAGRTARVAGSVAPTPRSPISNLPGAIYEPSVAMFEETSQVSDIKDLTIDPHLVAMTGRDPLAVERYQSLAVRLLNLTERRKLKTVLITSAEAAEGKTAVATNVAWLLAKRPGRRVLLIDASLASPSVARALGIEAQRGWLDLAERSCKPEQSIIRLDPNGLYVLTPGPPAATQSSNSLSLGLEKLIAELARRFDLVVVDSPAIVESPEAQHLATVLGGAVIVARAGRTHRDNVTAARKLIPKERRLGIVLNESERVADITDRRRKASSLGRLFRRNKKPS